MPIPEQQSFVPSFPPLAAFGGSPLYVTGEDALKLTVQRRVRRHRDAHRPHAALRRDAAVPFKQTMTPATDRSASVGPSPSATAGC
jgi:hypothetical protein